MKMTACLLYFLENFLPFVVVWLPSTLITLLRVIGCGICCEDGVDRYLVSVTVCGFNRLSCCKGEAVTTTEGSAVLLVIDLSNYLCNTKE